MDMDATKTQLICQFHVSYCLCWQDNRTYGNRPYCSLYVVRLLKCRLINVLNDKFYGFSVRKHFLTPSSFPRPILLNVMKNRAQAKMCRSFPELPLFSYRYVSYKRERFFVQLILFLFSQRVTEISVSTDLSIWTKYMQHRKYIIRIQPDCKVMRFSYQEFPV
jgi:hypothetical protein